MIEQSLVEYLSKKGKTITLDELEKYIQAAFLHEYISYQEFAQAILTLVQEKSVLLPIGRSKAGHRNGRNPSLHIKYRNLISPERTPRSKKEITIEGYHPAIRLDYYNKKTVQLEKDEPAIRVISDYLTNRPQNEKVWEMNERSLTLFGHEKWLKANESILTRVGITREDLCYRYSPEPFAYRKRMPWIVSESLLVLVIENKDTYKSFERLFKKGIAWFGGQLYDLLVYGGGKRILSSLPYLYEIDEYDGQEVIFDYFGDIDAEGISIWHHLMCSYPQFTIRPCRYFYENLVKKAYDKIRNLDESEQKDVEGLDLFLASFGQEEARKITNIVKGKQILPQEGLNYSFLYELGDVNE
ncbi:hypothetical protein [Bacillus sp. FJAT-27251]|uniref:hypothetical protein n=1 Tax=Bacillus sp. FJAT-27251 TaxID=1684142 RepID=UPI0006A769D4|nr:hypothetical protein [Bacillus sp. FJAT-27251]